MAIKVSYKQGTKATYLGLLNRDPYALYFCTDTKELFRGDDLYSDGLRLVSSFDALPSFALAADGILYFCKDNGCGYVLSENRDEWIPIVYGIDNATIGLNSDGLLSVKNIQMDTVVGLNDKLTEIESRILSVDSASLKPSDEFTVSDDGVLSIQKIEPAKISGLEDRLQTIEQAIVGGVRYCGAVERVEDLPTDASVGSLYEVYEDNSEWCWNGERWFEYGKTIELPETISIDDICRVAKLVDYEISHKPYGTIVNYLDSEIRVMCPSDTVWTHQDSGENSDANAYYIGFKAYAPNNNIVSFKEDLAEIISDTTMYYFEDNEFAGIDDLGRKYSIVWLPVARYDDSTGEWTYYGSMSTDQKYIGWHYSVEWFDSNGVRVAADTIRINLTNETCGMSSTPYYVSELQATISSLEESYTWLDM